MYPDLENVAASYFSVELGVSNIDAAKDLRRDLEKSEIWRDRYKADVISALEDKNYSWGNLFRKWGVDNFESEEEARTIGREIFFDSIFNYKET